MIASIVASLASASTPAPSVVREHAGVSLVEVPVTVLDSRGKPVRDLKADDFQVFDNGTEVKIESLDINDHLVAAALQYLSRGYRPIALVPGQKMAV